MSVNFSLEISILISSIHLGLTDSTGEKNVDWSSSKKNDEKMRDIPGSWIYDDSNAVTCFSTFPTGLSSRQKNIDDCHCWKLNDWYCKSAPLKVQLIWISWSTTESSERYGKHQALRRSPHQISVQGANRIPKWIKDGSRVLVRFCLGMEAISFGRGWTHYAGGQTTCR